MIYLLAKENIYTLMEMFIKELLSITKKTDMEYINTPTKKFTMVIIKMTLNKAKEFINIKMDLSIMEIGKKGKNKVMVF